MKTIYPIFSIFLLAFFLGVGCKTHKKSGVNEREGATWMAVSLYENPISEVDFMRGSPSIIFNDSTSISGSTGCNQFSAKYSENSKGVKISMGPMTKIACPGSDEKTFIKALTETNRIERGENQVVFYNEEKELIKFNVMR